MSSIGVDPYRLDRHRMVEAQIRARGLTDPRVLEAMETVPREQFVLPQDSAAAFEDRALGIDCGQTISQPFMVASMTAALRVEPHHRVLEIGTGSGYQTAILAQLANHVYTIERIPPLKEKAEALLKLLRHTNVSYRVGDGSLGWPEESPFDGIIVTAGAPHVPEALVEQLTDGGRLVIPVGHATEQILTVVERTGDRTHEMPQYPCRFVKLLGRQGWKES
jgi:protein-L-isoaspartate(D-aspartate) O-methyltransferase